MEEVKKVIGMYRTTAIAIALAVIDDDPTPTAA